MFPTSVLYPSHSSMAAFRFPVLAVRSKAALRLDAPLDILCARAELQQEHFASLPDEDDSSISSCSDISLLVASKRKAIRLDSPLSFHTETTLHLLASISGDDDYSSSDDDTGSIESASSLDGSVHSSEVPTPYSAATYIFPSLLAGCTYIPAGPHNAKSTGMSKLTSNLKNAFRSRRPIRKEDIRIVHRVNVY